MSMVAKLYNLSLNLSVDMSLAKVASFFAIDDLC